MLGINVTLPVKPVPSADDEAQQPQLPSNQLHNPGFLNTLSRFFKH